MPNLINVEMKMALASCVLLCWICLIQLASLGSAFETTSFILANASIALSDSFLVQDGSSIVKFEVQCALKCINNPGCGGYQFQNGICKLASLDYLKAPTADPDGSSGTYEV